jgi:putative transcriptional regulator
MTIRHHPTRTLLIAYASGTTSEAEALAISTHMAFCPECRAAAKAAEAIGGALLDSVARSPMSTGALMSVLARLDEGGEETPSPGSVSSAVPSGLPRGLASYVSEALTRSDWRMMAPGIKQLPLHVSGRGKAWLLKLKPGTVLPEHTHRGTELTLLLSGSYTDEIGHFARGDMAELDDAVTHRPVVDQGETCIALVITEAPLKFHGWMARLAQPLIGI